jgi:hypothetical protein
MTGELRCRCARAQRPRPSHKRRDREADVRIEDAGAHLNKARRGQCACMSSLLICQPILRGSMTSRRSSSSQAFIRRRPARRSKSQAKWRALPPPTSAEVRLQPILLGGTSGVRNDSLRRVPQAVSRCVRKECDRSMRTRVWDSTKTRGARSPSHIVRSPAAGPDSSSDRECRTYQAESDQSCRRQ